MRALKAEGFSVVEYNLEPHWVADSQCTFFR